MKRTISILLALLLVFSMIGVALATYTDDVDLLDEDVAVEEVAEDLDEDDADLDEELDDELADELDDEDADELDEEDAEDLEDDTAALEEETEELEENYDYGDYDEGVFFDASVWLVDLAIVQQWRDAFEEWIAAGGTEWDFDPDLPYADSPFSGATITFFLNGVPVPADFVNSAFASWHSLEVTELGNWEVALTLPAGYRLATEADGVFNQSLRYSLGDGTFSEWVAWFIVPVSVTTPPVTPPVTPPTTPPTTTPPVTGPQTGMICVTFSFSTFDVARKSEDI